MKWALVTLSSPTFIVAVLNTLCLYTELPKQIVQTHLAAGAQYLHLAVSRCIPQLHYVLKFTQSPNQLSINLQLATLFAQSQVEKHENSLRLYKQTVLLSHKLVFLTIVSYLVFFYQNKNILYIFYTLGTLLFRLQKLTIKIFYKPSRDQPL